jgi:receptor expression-enhancing protein 5/6
VPKAYAALGLLGVYFFLVFFNIGGEFLTNLAGFAIPGYYSMAALFTATKSDDTQVRFSVFVCLCLHANGTAVAHGMSYLKRGL